MISDGGLDALPAAGGLHLHHHKCLALLDTLPPRVLGCDHQLHWRPSRGPREARAVRRASLGLDGPGRQLILVRLAVAATRLSGWSCALLGGAGPVLHQRLLEEAGQRRWLRRISRGSFGWSIWLLCLVVVLLLLLRAEVRERLLQQWRQRRGLRRRRHPDRKENKRRKGRGAACDFSAQRPGTLETAQEARKAACERHAESHNSFQDGSHTSRTGGTHTAITALRTHLDRTFKRPL